MSRETYTTLNTQTLIGFTAKRGNAWHYRADMQEIDPVTGHVGNHYPGPIPIEHVEKRLFNWEAVSSPVWVGRPGNDDELIEAPKFQAVVHSETEEVFKIFSDTYEIHQYQETLIERTQNILDDDLQIGSAGVLRNGARAWVSVEVPNTIKTKDGVEFRPSLIACTSHDGTLATTWKRHATLVVCHAANTFVIDGEWRGLVQDHPSATEPVLRNGREIEIRGIPFSEHVSEEHRYWVRERRRNLTPKKRVQLDSASSVIGTDREAAWVEARDISPVKHEIGFPIDMREESVPTGISDLESAWILGYGWGNGHANKANNRQITLSIPTAREDLIHRVSTFAKAAGWKGKPTVKQGCVQITFSNDALNSALKEFTHEGWAQKVPAVWVERAPLEWQRALVQGYYAADGNTDTTEGCIISSVSLDGLLSLRRILSRLNVPSSIRRGSDPSLRSTIQGRQVNAQLSYTIRFYVNVEQLGYSTRFHGKFSHPSIEDGYMWSRVESVNEWQGEVWPITTESHQYVTDFGLSHNCDNTMDMALAEAGQQHKIRHKKNSVNRMITEARDALNIIFDDTEEFENELNLLCHKRVTEKQWGKFLDVHIPVPDKVGSGKTLAEKKRDEFEDLWRHDERVTPWKGSKFGVLQCANTWQHHLSRVKGGEELRADKNMEDALSDRTAKYDIQTLADLEKAFALA